MVALSLLYWMRKKNSGRFNTFILYAYLAFLLLLGGMRFYWEEIFSGGRGAILGTGLAEFAGYALLLYYLPATVNHIIGRSWTPLRLSVMITASTVYFILSTVYLFTRLLKQIALAATLLYIISLAVILVDIVRVMSLIKQGTTRRTVLMVTLLTIAFLPLVMVGQLWDGSGGQWEMTLSLRFMLLSLYYFLMALSGIVFYMKEMSSDIGRQAVEYTQGIDINVDLPLTVREKDVADSVVRGLTYEEIAENLDISPNTVRNHVSNLYRKLSVRSKIELIQVLGGRQNY